MSEVRVPKWWQPYAAEFPEWRAHKGTNQLFYARLPGTDPLVIVRGEDPEDLRDMIRAEISRRES